MDCDSKLGLQHLRAKNFKAKGRLILHTEIQIAIAPVHELSHKEYVLQKLEDEIYAFKGDVTSSG